MSLANRLSAVQANQSNRGGCRTCQWLRAIPKRDREAFDQWLAEKLSLAQLWEVATADPDHPLPVSLTSFRHHVRSHHEP